MLKRRVKEGGSAKELATRSQHTANKEPKRSPAGERAGGSRGGIIYFFGMFKAYLSDLRPKGLGGFNQDN